MAKRPLPTVARVSQLLSYDPVSGEVRWKEKHGTRGYKRWNKLFSGNIAGCASPGGYQIIKIDGYTTGAHRIAWLLTHGEWPADVIDHIDGDGFNNRIDNLRSVTRKINQRNQRRHSTNTSGITGVSWNWRTNKFVASIKISDKSRYLGSHRCIMKAAMARKAAERKYGFTGRVK